MSIRWRGIRWTQHDSKYLSNNLLVMYQHARAEREYSVNKAAQEILSPRVPSVTPAPASKHNKMSDEAKTCC